MDSVSSILEARARRIHRSYYNYDPSEALAIVALVLYAISTILHIYQYVKYRAWYWTAIIIAGIMQTFGYLSRIFSARDPFSRGLYIASFALVVLAPVFTAAGNYILLGKLLERVLPGGRHARTLKVPARWITLIFVSSDIFSFLLQGAGAGILSANADGENPKAQERGTNIMRGGLLLQIAFFSFFTCAVIRFDIKTRKTHPGAKWRRLIYALYLSCVLILTRSIYRVVEFSEGWNGYLISHEVYFYTLEALPMLPCLVIYNIFHPSKWLPDQSGADTTVVQELGLESGSSIPSTSNGIALEKHPRT